MRKRKEYTMRKLIYGVSVVLFLSGNVFVEDINAVHVDVLAKTS